MKVIYNKILPFPGYKAINLFGFLFVRTGEVMSEVDLNHERIHTEQQKELGYIFFYLWYLIEYIIVRIYNLKCQGCAYHDISFEEEAYLRESNLLYISSREHYSWIKYVRPGSYGLTKKDYDVLGRPDFTLVNIKEHKASNIVSKLSENIKMDEESGVIRLNDSEGRNKIIFRPSGDVETISSYIKVTKARKLSSTKTEGKLAINIEGEYREYTYILLYTPTGNKITFKIL